MSANGERHVFWLNLQMGHGERAIHFSAVFETHLAGVDEIAAQLAQDRVVCGHKLDTLDDGRGGKLIRARHPFAFGVAGLVNIQDYRHPVWEPEE